MIPVGLSRATGRAIAYASDEHLEQSVCDILTTPKLARIDGMETFQGESFHTSRWNYNVNLEGKHIGIIGTGATAAPSA